MLIRTIEHLCRQNGLTVSGLEKALGLSKSSISRWEESKPRIDNVQKVAKFFDVSVDFLLAGKEYEDAHEFIERKIEYEEKRNINSTDDENGRRSTDNDKNLILQELSAILKNYGGDKIPQETRKIPIVSTIKCGTNGIAYEDVDAYLMVDETLHGDLFVLRAKGDSMQGKGIFDGDLAIIRRQEMLENGEIGAFLIDGEEATLKRYVVIPNGVALEAANPLYETRYFSDVDKNRLYIIGKLVEIRKRF